MDIFNNLDLAESKLILLYAIHKLKIPITNNQLVNIMIENNIMNYFSLQQYLNELVNSKFVEIKSEDEKKFYFVTADGEKILNYFINRVPFTVKEKIGDIMESNTDKIKQEIEIIADYIPEKMTEYIVECKVNEHGITLIDFKVNVPTKDQAKLICENWRKHGALIFGEIFESLIKERE